MFKSTYLLFLISFVFCTQNPNMIRAQDMTLTPQSLSRDYLVKLVMKDSSHFYGIVLVKPVPDRILFETRNGKLEIPLSDIDYAVDYRFNFVMNKDLKDEALANRVDAEKYRLAQYLNSPRQETPTIITTKEHDTFRGYRYEFDDSAHVILATEWGELYFTYPEILEADNFSGTNDTRTEFYTTSYLNVKDPKTSQGFITPNGFAFGAGNNFLADYLLGGLQINYGATGWLSMNLGGVFLPLTNNVIVATGGMKFTPLATGLWHISAGVQGLYSQVVKTTHLGLGYAAFTYGTWESQLTLFGGYTINSTDSGGMTINTKNDEIIAIQGAARVGENLKLGVELFFISNFEIVPVLISMRYFDNSITVDAGVAFSLYKAGAAQTTPTLGYFVFNVQDFPIVPVLSASYHF